MMTLTSEQERRQKPVEVILDEWLTIEEELDEPKPKTGAEVLASWERKGVFGKVFMDRPEDSPELARKLRAEANQ